MGYEKLYLSRRTEHHFWLGSRFYWYMHITIRIWDGHLPQFMLEFK